jgi:hypothetical protein
LTIVLLVEGSTEKTLTDKIKEHLDQRAESLGRPRVALRAVKIKNIEPHALGQQIRLHLQTQHTTDVVGLIDVFPHFTSAPAAKLFLREAAERAGVRQHFHPHAAQYDVEAWLLPYWDDICRRIGVKQGPPGGNPEMVDDLKPPSYRLKELYQRAGRKYVKTIEMPAILKGKDLSVAAKACAELRNLLDTLLLLSNLS